MNVIRISSIDVNSPMIQIRNRVKVAARVIHDEPRPGPYTINVMISAAQSCDLRCEDAEEAYDTLIHAAQFGLGLEQVINALRSGHQSRAKRMAAAMESSELCDVLYASEIHNFKHLEPSIQEKSVKDILAEIGEEITIAENAHA